MNDSQHAITLADTIDDHPHRQLIIDLVEGNALALHLAEDRVDVFRAPGDLGVESLFGQLLAQTAHHTLDDALPSVPPEVQLPADLLVAIVVQIAEGLVFELPLELPDAKPVRQ